MERQDAIRVMHAAIDEGITFFDNAWVFSLVALNSLAKMASGFLVSRANPWKSGVFPVSFEANQVGNYGK